MKSIFLRNLLSIFSSVALPLTGSAQVLHSSIDPNHVVHWEMTGLHSSINPSVWVNGDKVTSVKTPEKAVPLKEPIIPYRSEKDMQEAKAQAAAETKAKKEAELKKEDEVRKQQELSAKGVYQTGKATYYSAKMHGRKMADGSLYDKNALFCAHRTLPFGTMLRVVNKKNGKEVVVCVKDRGPFGKGLVIDLSNKAASVIDMVSDGVVPVELYIVEK